MTTLDTIWSNVVLLAGPNWTSQISYEAVASLLLKQSVCAVLMYMHTITAEYNGPLEAAHSSIEDDRYDLVECGAAGRPTLDLSDRLRGSSIASALAIRLRSANMLVYYHRRVK